MMPVNKSLAELTVEVVNTYLANNQIDLDEVPTLIAATHAALQKIAWGKESSGKAPAKLHILPPEGEGEVGTLPAPSWKHAASKQRPAVPIERSVTPDHIICLEDGRRYKMLKGALRTRYNMSPEQYRRKWNLPPDYPMTAPNYSAKRKKISFAIGLGKDITRPSRPSR